MTLALTKEEVRTKSKRGPKPRPTEMTKVYSGVVLLTKEERDRMFAEAEKAHVSVSELLRRGLEMYYVAQEGVSWRHK